MTSISRRRFAGNTAAAALAGLAGIPLARQAMAQDATADASASASPAPSPVVGDDTRVVSAVNGEITITGTPQRVVALEYELCENLSILGVMPVGVAERDSVPQWVQIPTYPSDVVDVGARDELDIEAIAALKPDLILAASPRQDEVLDKLEAIAPVVQLATYSPFATPQGETPVENFQGILTKVAIAVNKEAEAQEAIAAFNALLAEGAKVVGGSEFAGRSFLYGSFNDQAEANLFNNRARTAFILSELGLENVAPENTENPKLHYAPVSVEQLGTFPAETLFFMSQSAANASEFTAFFNSDIWKAIPFVAAGNFHNLGEPNIWTAGSTITMSDFIRRVVKDLTGTELA
ncbi:MAG: iron-siderophore ABC transporter substrate-binding protein [Thermomicrobiales bacterium]